MDTTVEMPDFSAQLIESSLIPGSHWSDAHEAEHFVQFYETDPFLLDSLRGYIGAALIEGSTGIVIATQEHREGLAQLLRADGFDLDSLTADGRYVSIDAAETLERCLADGVLDPGRFETLVGAMIEAAATGGRKVYIFGEIVALLGAEGKHGAAIHLEALWNDLRRRHVFSLFCAYPMSGFGQEALGQSLGDVCSAHARVIPAESYTTLSNPEERLRAIALLQQKAGSLDSEIAERKLSEERFRFLAESMPQKIFTARPTGELDYFNRQWSEFTGLPIDEIQHWGWTRVLHPEDVAATVQLWQRSIITGEPLQTEHRIRAANGRYRWHLSSAHPMRDANGAITVWIGSDTDIDDQKSREAALNRSIRLRDEFLSAISHDLRTPLTVLRGQAQILQRRARKGTLEEGVLLRALEQIENRSRMMSRLVDELLDITKLRAGEELDLDREAVDLVALVQDEATGCTGVAAGLELEILSADSQLIGFWDRTRLGRVIENLIGNAIKYSPHGGRITVTVVRETRPEGDRAVLTVQDTGIGILPDDLPHIFERFYRGRNANGGINGTGLGLAGARQIVGQHGGSIDVASTVGVGTLFTVRLPMGSGERMETASASEGATS